MQIERAAAGLLGMQVDLPRLAQRVGLDEVALVVHVEPVIDGVVLEVGDEAGDIDDGHVDKPATSRQYGGPAVTDRRARRPARQRRVRSRDRARRRRRLGPGGHDTRSVPQRPRSRRAAVAVLLERRGRRAVGGERAARRRPRRHRRARPARRLDERVARHPLVRRQPLRGRRGRPARRARRQPRHG